MSEDFFEASPINMMPAAVMMWAGLATMLFYTTATVMAYAYTHR